MHTYFYIYIDIHYDSAAIGQANIIPLLSTIYINGV